MATARKKATGFYRGAAGREKADEELAKQKARAEARKEQQHMPFRFRVKTGNSTQFVVLDDEPDFYRFEHNLKNPQSGIWDIYTGCVKETDNCPVCDTTGRESYYALYLSVLDFTEFETRDGQVHTFSRKLLVVKPAQQKKFLRAYAKAEKDGLTLRGAIFEVTRDGDKDSAIGNDIEFIEYMDEDELTSYVREWTDKDGKKQVEDCSVPFVYEDLFDEPDVESLRALVGAPPPPGSRAHERSALGGDRGRGRSRGSDEEDEPSTRTRGRTGGRGYERPARDERMRSRGRDAEGYNDADDDDGDGDDTRGREPARTRGRQAPEPVSRGRGRGRGGDSDRDGDDEDDEHSEAATSRPRGRGRTAPEPEERGRTGRRAAPVEDEPPPGRRLPVRPRRA